MYLRGRLEQHKLDTLRAEWGPALVASMLANIYRDPKKKQRAFEPRDFMPSVQAEAKTARGNWKNQLRMVRVLNAALGGTEVPRGKAERG